MSSVSREFLCSVARPAARRSLSGKIISKTGHCRRQTEGDFSRGITFAVIAFPDCAENNAAVGATNQTAVIAEKLNGIERKQYPPEWLLKSVSFAFRLGRLVATAGVNGGMERVSSAQGDTFEVLERSIY